MRRVLPSILVVLALMIALLMTILLGACDKVGKTLKVNKEPPPVTVTAGRYTIHANPHTPKETILIDSSTGRTWILSRDNGATTWVSINGGPDIDLYGIRGEGGKRFRILSVQEPDGKIILYDKQGNRLPDDPKKMTDNQLLDALGVERR